MSKKRPTPALPKELRSPMSKTLSSTIAKVLPYTPPSTPTTQSVCPTGPSGSPTNDEMKARLPEQTASKALVSPTGPSPSPTNNHPHVGLPEHKTSADLLTSPSPLSQLNLAQASSQPVRWLWQDRLPLSGITLLDGDHNCEKSLLALQLAAHISSGTPLPDGTPSLQGGVVIVTPHRDAATTQLQLLTAWGADLSRIVRRNVYSTIS